MSLKRHAGLLHQPGREEHGGLPQDPRLLVHLDVVAELARTGKIRIVSTRPCLNITKSDRDSDFRRVGGHESRR